MMSYRKKIYDHKATIFPSCFFLNIFLCDRIVNDVLAIFMVSAVSILIVLYMRNLNNEFKDEI